MGCDIHTYTEMKNSNGKWISADFLEENEYYDKDDPDSYEPPISVHQFYRGRDYGLFGALAGVRAEHIQHISPRGIPKDISDRVKKVYEIEGPDAHTASWLSLEELMDTDVKDLLLRRKIDKTYLTDFVNQLKNFLEYKFYKFQLENLYEHKEDFRVVFWFDN